jgi:hypothetical protein
MRVEQAEIQLSVVVPIEVIVHLAAEMHVTRRSN